MRQKQGKLYLFLTQYVCISRYMDQSISLKYKYKSNCNFHQPSCKEFAINSRLGIIYICTFLKYFNSAIKFHRVCGNNPRHFFPRIFTIKLLKETFTILVFIISRIITSTMMYVYTKGLVK